VSDPRPTRAAELVDRTAQRSRTAFWQRMDHLRDGWPSIALTAAAAAVAYLVAQELFDRRAAFFAPVAAILTLGLAGGRRGRTAVEIGVGVALGIGVADLLVLALGNGAWQLGVVVAIAIVAAVLAGGGPMLINQAAISAVLVVTLERAGEFSGARFVDALLGSAIALATNALIPADPLRLVRREAEPLLRDLGTSLERIAAALADNDERAARAALEHARGLDPLVTRLREALEAGHETTTLAPFRRRARGGLAPYARAVTQLDHAVRNTRVLARRAASAIEQGDRVPQSAIDSIEQLAVAIPDLATFLEDPTARDPLELAAIEAAAQATAALEVTGNLSANMIVGQVRSVATDLLGAAGIDAAAAREAVRGARGRLGI
jgi:uncharacterized membrane protein YgaE (UPF0421/DUF939 family)